jgi:hypothetical protein
MTCVCGKSIHYIDEYCREVRSIISPVKEIYEWWKGEKEIQIVLEESEVTEGVEKSYKCRECGEEYTEEELIKCFSD